jgi:hypothetical protein
MQRSTETIASLPHPSAAQVELINPEKSIVATSGEKTWVVFLRSQSRKF